MVKIGPLTGNLLKVCRRGGDGAAGYKRGSKDVRAGNNQGTRVLSDLSYNIGAGYHALLDGVRPQTTLYEPPRQLVFNHTNISPRKYIGVGGLQVVVYQNSVAMQF